MVEKLSFSSFFNCTRQLGSILLVCWVPLYLSVGFHCTGVPLYWSVVFHCTSLLGFIVLVCWIPLYWSAIVMVCGVSLPLYCVPLYWSAILLVCWVSLYILCQCKLAYSLWMLEKISELGSSSSEVFVMYDIACSLSKYLQVNTFYCSVLNGLT